MSVLLNLLWEIPPMRDMIYVAIGRLHSATSRSRPGGDRKLKTGRHEGRQCGLGLTERALTKRLRLRVRSAPQRAVILRHLLQDSAVSYLCQ